MSKKFIINEIAEEQEGFFDRQQLISWWNPEILQSAKVMVVGAGAIGNETLKNLALLGVGNIFIVDFDQISPSNLSRTVLFRKSDVKQNKAEIAAKRTLELCLYEHTKVDWFHGDAVWELGTGIFRSMDIVLGCLDNIETRFAINRRCRLAGVPWIDTGITELRGRVNVYDTKGACYECSMTKEQYEARRVRYSCDVFKKKMFNEGKVPTVQIASAWVSAIQVQEAIKLLHNQNEMVGHMVYYEGRTNDFDRFKLTENPDCDAHVRCLDIMTLPLTSSVSLEMFLHHISNKCYQGEAISLDISELNFVRSVECRSCQTPIYLLKPAFRVYDNELFCGNCQNKAKEGIDDNSKPHIDFVRKSNLIETEDTILKMSLRDIGIPFWHIVTIRDESGEAREFELQEDKHLLLPNIFNGQH